MWAPKSAWGSARTCYTLLSLPLKKKTKKKHKKSLFETSDFVKIERGEQLPQRIRLLQYREEDRPNYLPIVMFRGTPCSYNGNQKTMESAWTGRVGLLRSSVSAYKLFKNQIPEQNLSSFTCQPTLWSQNVTFSYCTVPSLYRTVAVHWG